MSMPSMLQPARDTAPVISATTPGRSSIGTLSSVSCAVAGTHCAGSERRTSAARASHARIASRRRARTIASNPPSRARSSPMPSASASALSRQMPVHRSGAAGRDARRVLEAARSEPHELAALARRARQRRRTRAAAATWGTWLTIATASSCASASTEMTRAPSALTSAWTADEDVRVGVVRGREQPVRAGEQVRRAPP